MAWQDELRRLDAELASGQIAHDQHRRLREDILAEASSGPAISPLAARNREAKAANGAAHDSPATGEVTEVMTPPDPNDPTLLLTTTRPTTAPSPADYRPTDSMPYPPPSAQKAHRPQPSAPHPGNTNGTAQQPVELTVPITRVPTGPVAGPPPRQAPPLPDWAEPPASKGKTGTWLLVSLGVLIALGAVIGGAWWLGTSGDKATPGSAMPAASSGPDGSEVALADKLPVLPGEPSPANSTMTVDKGADLGLYSTTDAQAMRDSGAKEVIYRASAEGESLTDGYTVIVIPADDSGAATSLTDQLSRTVTEGGFTAEPLADREGFVALSRTDSSGRVSVVWYVSGNVTVGVGVSQAPSADENVLRQRLLDTLTSVTAVLPLR
ncbi:hypothetical protein BAY61_00495 [Prauserella marina]|uniref:Uncharacterized protein n=1 Tax=Prauserella marina TaxID=530584 RepID=A0A222VIH3_9PSEU|nr:hypothetical protein [Prauserella marina]ASR33715.1 hypothetical protein BAY61_00495 [Prauserella marina]PWV82275.1 hypothetical protein DES30_102514 [Prauserella marina]SDC64977.1 hypothetical protein SAMN05421630_10350 [Prauserella marina]